MPVLKLLTEIIPQKNKILVTHTESLLGREILHQLEIYSYLETISVIDPSSTISEVDNLSVIIHLSGSTSPSLSETLSYTTSLYQLLRLAASSNAKFILVVSNSKSHLCQTAMTLINQFSKNYPISYQILEIDSKQSYFNLATSIIRQFIQNHEISTNLKQSETLKYHPKVRRNTVHISPKKILKIGILIITIPWLIFILLILILSTSAYCTYESIFSANFTLAKTCAKVSLLAGSGVRQQAKITLGAHYLFSISRLPLSSVLPLTDSLSRSVLLTVTANEVASQYLQSVLGSRPNSINPSNVTTTISSLSETLSGFQTDLNSYYQSNHRYAETTLQIGQSISAVKKFVIKLQETIPDFSQIMTTDKQVNIAVILQDNTRSKPTGGYLDTFIYITLESGKLIRSEIFTSKSVDSQLLGQATAPLDYKNVTGSTYWRFQDSNWDPDFPTTAKRIAWFIDKQLSRPVDIVVSTNLRSLAEIAQVINNNQSVNSYEQYLEKITTNSSSDGYIFSLAESTLDSLKTANSSQIDDLPPVLAHLLQSRQLQIYPISFTSAGLTRAGWDGEINLPQCRSSLPCVINYIYPTLTNLQNNHLDAYLEQVVSLNTKIESKSIVSTVNLKYSFSKESPSNLSSTYKGYLRIYFSPNNLVENVLLNNQPIPSDLYSVIPSQGLKLIGIPIELSTSSQNEIQVNLIQPLVHTSFHYQLDFPNQPGITPYPLDVEYSYPKEWFSTVFHTGSSLLPSVASPGYLRYNTATTHNSMVDFDLSQL